MKEEILRDAIKKVVDLSWMDDPEEVEQMKEHNPEMWRAAQIVMGFILGAEQGNSK